MRVLGDLVQQCVGSHSVFVQLKAGAGASGVACGEPTFLRDRRGRSRRASTLKAGQHPFAQSLRKLWLNPEGQSNLAEPGGNSGLGSASVCRLSLRERAAFRGAKGDNHQTETLPG